MALSASSGTVVLPVEITEARNCFVRLPRRCLGTGMGEESRTGAVALRLSWETTINEEKNNEIYVSWNGEVSKSDNVLEMPATLARLVGLDNSEAVKVDVVPCVQNAQRIHVEPLTCDDYEIVELNSELLERELLDQISILYTGQLLPVWIHTSILLTFKVKSFELDRRAAGAISSNAIFGGVDGGKRSSVACCRISAQAELIVEPKLRRTKNDNSLGRRLSGEFENVGQGPHLSRSLSRWLRAQPWKGWCGFKASTAVVPPEVYDDLCSASCNAFAPPKRKFLVAEILSKEQGNNKTALAFINNPTMAAAALCGKDMERGEEPRTMLTRGHVGLSKPLLQRLNMPLLGNVEVKPLVVENSSDSNNWTFCAPESVGLALHKVRWECDVEPCSGSAVGGGDGNLWSSELAPIKSSTPAMNLKIWCIGDSASACNDGMLLTPPPSIFTLLYNGMIIPLEGENYQVQLIDLTVLEKTKQLPTQHSLPHVESKLQSFTIFTATEFWDLVDYRLVLGSSIKLSLGKDTFYSGPTLETLGGVHTPAVGASNHLASIVYPEIAHLRRGMGTPSAGCILVWGGRGVGKSTFCLALAGRFRQLHGCYAYTSVVNCKSLVGQRLPLQLSILSDAVSDAVLHTPSILLFDDLDAIAGTEELEDGDPTSIQTTCVAEYLFDLLVERPDGVGVIASSAYRMALQPCLMQSRMFDTPIELTAPGPQERSEMLEKLATKQVVSSSCSVVVREQAAAAVCSVDWNFVGLSTDGCMPSDLSKLIFRAQHSAMLRNAHGLDEDCYSSSALTTVNSGYHESRRCSIASSHHYAVSTHVTQEDLCAALEGFTPDGHKSARLSVSSTSWNDIGGLHNVREKLAELLEMPIRYRRLLENSPTRIPRGILLYGPPGCGKTVVAGAAAKECGMTFIPVKGPEILDKYIGASEQRVRNLFYRAQSAAPCLLFFDEFESIAPRRGGDNSGVTDRVVNQLLTLLDGVEGMEGVYVMSATSRPDLVDPALLRPGRLDVHLLCSFPGDNERKEIAAALSRNIRLGPDPHKTLLEAAGSSAAMHFTGADLQGLVNTAHLNAVHKYLACKDGSKGEGVASERRGEPSSPSIVVTCADIEEAMASTRPTISAHERAGLLAMYKAFSGNRKAPFYRAMSPMNDGTLRTALR